MQSVPTFFIQSNMSYHHIVALSKQYTNDQEFGKMVREFISDIKAGKIYDNGHSNYEFAEWAKEIQHDDELKTQGIYKVTDNKLYRVIKGSGLEQGCICCYITENSPTNFTVFKKRVMSYGEFDVLSSMIITNPDDLSIDKIKSYILHPDEK